MTTLLIQELQVNQERFQTEHDADRYAEYVAMGWREPEPQYIGKVVFRINYWKEFLRKDGKILVELDKIMYGYKEAAH